MSVPKTNVERELWFAGLAMQSLLSSDDAGCDFVEIAEQAFGMADAMMEKFRQNHPGAWVRGNPREEG